MSKMDNLRAMREARYDEAAARSKGAPSRKPAARPPVAPAVPVDAEGAPKAPGPALCGHRAISGRVCTREHGHTEKSHRYS
jgi:hypothetical protein